MNWADKSGEQRAEAKLLVFAGTALCLSKMGDPLLASTDMQCLFFFSLHYVAAFETQNVLHRPGKGDLPCHQQGLKSSGLFLWLFSFTFFFPFTS